MKERSNWSIGVSVLLITISFVELAFLSSSKFLYHENEEPFPKDLFDRKYESSLSDVKEILTFVVVGDVHLGGGARDPTLLLEEVLKKSKEYKVEFIVLLGDLTQHGTDEEFKSLKKILDRAELSYYVVPGNHDIGPESTDAINSLNAYKNFFGPPYRIVSFPVKDQEAAKTLSLKKVNLVILDSTRRKPDGSLIPQEEWKWLGDNFADKPFKKNELTLFFSQSPLSKFNQREKEDLTQYLCKHRVGGFFAADLHRYEQFYHDCPIDFWYENFGGDQGYNMLPVFTVGALFKPLGFPGFLLVHYFDNRFFEIERITVGFQKEKK